jgi:hypothetical protein
VYRKERCPFRLPIYNATATVGVDQRSPARPDGRCGLGAKRISFRHAPLENVHALRQADVPVEFDPHNTTHFQAKMKGAPVWFCSFLAGKPPRAATLSRDELASMKGAWPLLMKQRRGGKWTAEEKDQLKGMVRSASSVQPLPVHAGQSRGRCCC